MSDENEQHPHLGAAAFALAKGVAGGRAKKNLRIVSEGGRRSCRSQS